MQWHYYNSIDTKGYNSKGWDDHKTTVSEEKHKSLLKKESYAEPWQLGSRQKRNAVISGPTLASHAGVLWSGVGNDYNKGL